MISSFRYYMKKEILYIDLTVVPYCFSSLELMVAEILSILLVYLLHLSMFSLISYFFLKFWRQDSQLFPISYYVCINYCHISQLIPISALYDFLLLRY